jgi:bacterioferritin-associated ferredoxin
VDPDDEICLCFHVSLRKVRTFLSRENPPVASLISECLGAGTGCRWCVPFLQHLHACHAQGKPVDLRVSPEAYASSRLTYHVTRDRDESILQQLDSSPGPQGAPEASDEDRARRHGEHGECGENKVE